VSEYGNSERCGGGWGFQPYFAGVDGGGGSEGEVVVGDEAESEAVGGDFAGGVFTEGAEVGVSVAMPWGDSERYDFVVWAEQGGPIFRVQVKGTGRLYRRGYEVQPVHATRRRGKRRYTAKEIDVVAAHVQPVDVWYLLPIAAVGRAKSLRFYPDIKSRRPMWEEYREAWEVLGRK